MENQGRHSPEGNETDTSAADQSSRKPYQERNDNGDYTTRRNDTIATQSSSLSCSNIVEITSDDEGQVVEIEGTPPKQENAHPQSSSQMSLRRKSPQLDVTCPVCLSEYDNKAFLDKCFRIFFCCHVPNRSTIICAKLSGPFFKFWPSNRSCLLAGCNFRQFNFFLLWKTIEVYYS